MIPTLWHFHLTNPNWQSKKTRAQQKLQLSLPLGQATFKICLPEPSSSCRPFWKKKLKKIRQDIP